MDNGIKACIFASLVTVCYTVHQCTVGGDGAIFASVVGVLAAIGGYVVGTGSGRNPPK